MVSLAVVALPAALALALCFYGITARNLWLDEAASLTIASQHGGALGSALAHDGGNMLGYYALLHVLVGWFGTGPLVLRIASALGAGVTVALVGGLGLRLFGRRPALLAGLLAAASLSMVYWGQNARAYTLMLAGICGSFWALVRLVQAPAWRWAPWLAYVTLTVAAVYAGLEAVLVLPAQLVVLAWHRDRWRRVLGALLAIAACCAPLAVLAVNRGSGQLFWVPPPSFRTLRQIVQSLSSSGLEPNYYTASGRFLLFLTLGLALLGAVRVGHTLWAGNRRPAAWAAVLVLAWLIVPLAITVVVSELGQSIFQARYLLVCLPAVALLLGWVLDGIWRGRDSLTRWPVPARRLAAPGAAVALLTTLLVLRALQVAPSYGKSSEPWQATASYVSHRARPGDCLAFYPLDVRMPFRYYLQPISRAPAPVLPNLPWSQMRPYIEQYLVPSQSSLAAATARCARVWLVSSHAGEADGPPRSRANYQSYLVLLGRLGQRYPRLESAGFGYAGLISVSLLSG